MNIDQAIEKVLELDESICEDKVRSAKRSFSRKYRYKWACSGSMYNGHEHYLKGWRDGIKWAITIYRLTEYRTLAPMLARELKKRIKQDE